MTRTIQITDNVTRFKEILLELHRGADPSSLFDRFHEVITSATADECDEIRNQMLIEGVPKKRARKWSQHHLHRLPLDTHRTN